MKTYTLAFYRIYLQIYFFFAPQKAAYKLLMLFATPRVRKLRPYEEQLLGKAKQENITLGKHTIRTYTWGEETPGILLVHGWEGHGGNMAGIADRLVQLGHTCMAFDAPAHGKSQGKRSTLFAFSECITELFKKYPGMHTVIAHSFGSAASVYTLSRTPHQVQKFALLSTPDRFRDVFDEFYTLLRLTNKQQDQVNASFEKNFHYPIDALQVSNDGKNTNIAHAVLLHDKNDKQIEYACAERVSASWPALKLIPLQDVGHYRMLWNDDVMATLFRELKF